MILVMAAAGSVLAAPVFGRLGAPGIADAFMWLGAGCGVAAFAVAAAVTVRAARRSGDASAPEEGE